MPSMTGTTTLGGQVACARCKTTRFFVYEAPVALVCAECGFMYDAQTAPPAHPEEPCPA